jgi:hypothetical protein
MTGAAKKSRTPVNLAGWNTTCGGMAVLDPYKLWHVSCMDDGERAALDQDSGRRTWKNKGVRNDLDG